MDVEGTSWDTIYVPLKFGHENREEKNFFQDCGTGLILLSPFIGRETKLLELLQALLCA